MIKNVDDLKYRPIEIDLTGPDGNAYVLLGTARELAQQIGLNGDKICEEMKSGDYDKLVTVFDKYFGSVVTLYR